MGRINISRCAGANLIRSLDGSDQHHPHPISIRHPELDQTLKVVKVTLYRLPKPLRLWVAPSTVTGGYLSTSSSFDSVIKDSLPPPATHQLVSGVRRALYLIIM
ncbi:hypothetical protein B296_00049895 [Ensete ventricosum]|uniref:Uncharacterized protein n=1 Tax=Ensete ventricosum TaxID=4639 RepID=A0A426YNU0_ENSVE|nr:hypothetical protein B296_00049895 [Ensete ventricosum]